MKRGTSRSEVKPPEINGCRVLKYALVRRPVRYNGRNYLFVIDSASGKSSEVGAVPRLVIAQPLRGSREYYLLHCNRAWKSIGTHAGFKSLTEAKQRAERSYPGIGKLWQSRGVSKKQALAYERRQWQGAECSFCGRIPPEIRAREGTALVLSQSGSASICRLCIQQFAEFIEAEKPQPNSG